MRCRKIERWISDSIDRRLSAEKRRILESHLAGCALCRAYRDRLARIQKESPAVRRPELAPGHWQESLSRLKAGLQAPETTWTKPKSVLKPAFSLRWQWAGAAAFLIIAFGLYFFLSGPNASHEIVAFSSEEAMSGIAQEIGDNPEFAKDLDALIGDTVYGDTAESIEAVNPFHYENPLFLESLNEEELQALDAAIKMELKI